MRAATKLQRILTLFIIDIELDEKTLEYRITLVSKIDQSLTTFEGERFSEVLHRCYQFKNMKLTQLQIENITTP